MSSVFTTGSRERCQLPRSRSLRPEDESSRVHLSEHETRSALTTRLSAAARFRERLERVAERTSMSATTLAADLRAARTGEDSAGDSPVCSDGYVSSGPSPTYVRGSGDLGSYRRS